MINYQYQITEKIWQYSGKGAWYFISINKKISKEIRTLYKANEEGWGRIKVTAKINNSEWKTAIWFDTKSSTFLLPIKLLIRKKENIDTEKKVTVHIYI